MKRSWPVAIAIFVAILFLCSAATAQQPLPFVHLTSPENGEVLKILDVVSIRWTTDCNLGVRLYLTQTDGRSISSLGLIAQISDPSVRLYRWTVGKFDRGTAKAGTGYRILGVCGPHLPIPGLPGGGSGYSGTFAICPRIDVRSPDGGESWRLGTEHNITIEYYDGEVCIVPWGHEPPPPIPVTVDLMLTRAGSADLTIDQDYPAAFNCPSGFSIKPWRRVLNYSWQVGALDSGRGYMEGGRDCNKIKARVTMLNPQPFPMPGAYEAESDGTFTICNYDGLCMQQIPCPDK